MYYWYETIGTQKVSVVEVKREMNTVILWFLKHCVKIFIGIEKLHRAVDLSRCSYVPMNWIDFWVLHYFQESVSILWWILQQKKKPLSANENVIALKIREDNVNLKLKL